MATHYGMTRGPRLLLAHSDLLDHQSMCAIGLHRHQINLLVLYFFPYIDVRATSARPTCLCTSLNTSLTTMPSRPPDEIATHAESPDSYSDSYSASD